MKNKLNQRSGITPAAIAALAVGDFSNFLVASTPGGIEAQEKRGQMEQAQKQTLPRKMGENRQHLEALGFKFGAFADDLFIECEFPKGWQKVPTDHSMWSDLVDANGHKRGAIFYKAAFYDRSAHMNLCPRFYVGYGDYAQPTESREVKDACGPSPFGIHDLARPDWNDREEAKRRDDICEAARTKCFDWLKANYPDFENPLAYWPA